MLRRDLVIVGCGTMKQPNPAPARDLYTGPYPRNAVKWADSVGARVLILSAHHGLIDGDTIIAPYNAAWSKKHRPGNTDTVARLETIAGQMTALGITDGEVVVLAGKDYLARIYAASNRTVTPRNIFRSLAQRRYGDGRTGYQSRLLQQYAGRWPEMDTQ